MQARLVWIQFVIQYGKKSSILVNTVPGMSLWAGSNYMKVKGRIKQRQLHLTKQKWLGASSNLYKTL